MLSSTLWQTMFEDLKRLSVKANGSVPNFLRINIPSGVLCQYEVDFQAQLDAASISERVKVFTFP